MSRPYGYSALGQEDPNEAPPSPRIQAPPPYVQQPPIPASAPAPAAPSVYVYAPVDHIVSLKQQISIDACGYLRPAFGVYKTAPGAFSACVAVMFACGLLFGGLATTAALALGPVALIVDFGSKLVQTLAGVALLHFGLGRMRGTAHSVNDSFRAVFTRKEIVYRCAGYQAAYSLLQIGAGLIAGGVIALSVVSTGSDPEPMVVLAAAAIAWLPLGFGLFLTMYLLPALADGMPLVAAARLSARGVAAEMASNLLLAVSAGLVAISGLLACGLGLLVTIPLGMLMNVHGYLATYDCRPLVAHPPAQPPSLV